MDGWMDGQWVGGWMSRWVHKTEQATQNHSPPGRPSGGPSASLPLASDPNLAHHHLLQELFLHLLTPPQSWLREPSFCSHCIELCLSTCQAL